MPGIGHDSSFSAIVADAVEGGGIRDGSGDGGFSGSRSRSYAGRCEAKSQGKVCRSGKDRV